MYVHVIQKRRYGSGWGLDGEDVVESGSVKNGTREGGGGVVCSLTEER